MRLLLDTCVIIEWLTDPDSISDKVWDILNDPQCKLYVSAETARELIVSFNNKKLLSKYWHNADEMLRAMKEEAMVDILPITEQVVFTYSRLQLNLTEDHRDPSDHIIISHAIAEHLTLLSSDTRFHYYRKQGLELIEY